jgi:hypothetical protein
MSFPKQVHFLFKFFPHHLGSLGHVLVLLVASDEHGQLGGVNLRVGEDAKEELRGVPQLLAQVGGVDDVDNAPGGALERVYVPLTNPLVSRNVNNLNSIFAGSRERSYNFFES